MSTSLVRNRSLRDSGLTLLGFGLVTITGGSLYGLGGSVVGIVALGSWLALPLVYAVGIAQVGIAVVAGPEPGLGGTLLLEGSLLAVLVGDSVDERTDWVDVVVGIGVIGGAGALAFLAVSVVDALWQAALLVAGTVLFLSHRVHRFSVVHFENNEQ